MKTILTALTVCLAAIASSAQTADIEVSYMAHSPNMKNGKPEVTNQYILLSNPTDSKFYSPRTEYIDSLNSTPEGKAVYQEMARSAYFSGKMKEMPKRDGKYYVTKNLSDNKLKYYDVVGLSNYSYEETPGQLQWTIGDVSKEILGYECIAAETDYHGRHWTVWFAPEIPIQNGPWKFDGLPGLILEAECDGGLYRFIATGIQQTTRPITPVFGADSYELTERKVMLKEQRDFLDNTLNRLNAQFGGRVSIQKVKDKDGNDISGSIFVSREVVDFIETDY
ncbi:MAG: GLPGLI family protein [Paramuribaculum sp.]|nr:GLPGLI family protein [Paramuribaculum sp.]